MMKKAHLEIEALRAFVNICDTGSFSAAAEQLGRTQSAISVQIRRLEDVLGQTLLRRVQGRVEGATAEGDLLLGYAREILRLNDEVYASVAENTVVGTLRAGVPEELMEGVFPATLARFSALYPRIRIVLRTDMGSVLRQALAAGELELIVFKHCDNTPPKGTQSLWRESLVWAAGEGYATALTARTAPLPLALLGENCSFRVAATAALAKAKIPWQQSFAGSSMSGVRQAIRCGLGISILPRSLLEPGMVDVSKGMPALPDVHFVSALAPGQPHPVAERLVALLAEQIQQQRGIKLRSAA